VKQTKAKRAKEKERLAEVEFRSYIIQIPDNEMLIRILLGFEKPFRSEFYRKALPYFRFKPVPLESIYE
jgi:hypothetical protein